MFVEPASQSRQSEDEEEPTALTYLPTSHVVQTAVTAASAYFPSTQATQSEMDVDPVEGLLFPTPQSVQAPPAPS